VSIWTLVAVLCVAGMDSCQQADVGAFPDEASCAAAVPYALGALQRNYVLSWIERAGTAPPPARVGMGCREDEST
jgi:hypothetical protein